MHLVMLCHNQDDLPIRLFARDEYEEAIRFARRVKAMPTETMRRVLDADCSTPNCVKIVYFAGGVPTKSEVIKTFD